MLPDTLLRYQTMVAPRMQLVMHPLLENESYLGLWGSLCDPLTQYADQKISVDQCLNQMDEMWSTYKRE